MTKKTAERFEEVEVLEAEVIEESVERIDLTPAVIDAKSYLAALKTRLDQLLEPYADMDDEAICAMDAKEAKTCRADLNRIIKEVEGQRKVVKEAYNEPLKRFEDAVKALLEPAKDGEKRLGQYINDQVQIQRDMRRMTLENAYEDYAPALVPVVPFDRIMEVTNTKWLNKSYSEVKATDELLGAVDRIAREWESLNGMADSLAFYQEAEAEFFRTLNLNDALELNRRRTEEQAAIEAMKAEVEANRQAVEPEPMPEPEPEPVFVATDIRVPYVIRIDLSAFEKARLMDFIKAEGIGANRTIGRAKEKQHV